MKRYFVKRKEFIMISQAAPLGIQNVLAEKSSEKKSIEKIAFENFEVFLIENQPVLIKKSDGKVFPPLTFSEGLAFLPRIVIDQGAVPFLCNGADIMRPGVVNVDGKFSTGSLLTVVEERFKKVVAVGLSLFSDEDIRLLKQGKVVENIHFVGDNVWSFIKNLKKM